MFEKLRVYNEWKLIRQYIISDKRRRWQNTDFPEDKIKMFRENYPQSLINQARTVCKEAGEFIESILKPHAYLNYRRAQGLLNSIKKNQSHECLKKVCIKAKNIKIVSPKVFEKILENEAKQFSINFQTTGVYAHSAAARDMFYYIK